MKLNNFRVVRVDSMNLTFEEYKKVESKRNNVVTSATKWVRVGGYYGNLDQCLDGLKKYIINTFVDLTAYQDVLAKINELNNAIVECVVKLDSPKTKAEPKVDAPVRIADEDL